MHFWPYTHTDTFCTELFPIEIQLTNIWQFCCLKTSKTLSSTMKVHESNNHFLTKYSIHRTYRMWSTPDATPLFHPFALLFRFDRSQICALKRETGDRNDVCMCGCSWMHFPSSCHFSKRCYSIIISLFLSLFAVAISISDIFLLTFMTEENLSKYLNSYQYRFAFFFTIFVVFVGVSCVWKKKPIFASLLRTANATWI